MSDMEMLQEAPDLGIPQTKPAIESIRGVWEQKMSPQRRHALVQGRLCAMLITAFADRGEAGTEWRFYLLPKGEEPSSLVPDVAYVSYERMPESYGELREQPTIAPDIAVEILSPGDSMRALATKIGLYLKSGAKLVIVVDPIARTLALHDTSGSTTFEDGEIATPASYPELRIDLRALFHRL